MKILFIEDEDAALRRLEKIVLEIDPKIEIIKKLDSVESSVSWLRNNPPPDLIFLDIHLADGSCFEIFEHVQVNCPIIFTTAYDEYALKAFKVNAIDYLMKPIKPLEVKEALEKYKKITPAPVPDYAALIDRLQGQQLPSLRRILVRLGQSIRLVETDDVAYFYTRDKITFLMTQSTSKRYPIDHPLDKLEEMLDPKVFYRINRQFIVHVAAIREMHPYSKSRIKIDLDPPSDVEIIVSTERSSDFKQWLVGVKTS